MSTGFVKALGKIGHMIPQYDICVDMELSFISASGGTKELSADLVTSNSGTSIISSYVIDWNRNSADGQTLFTSGYNPQTSVDVLHPFVNYSVLDGGDLYAVIKYIVINGIKYSPTFRQGQWSPDLKLCLGSVYVEIPPEIDCLDGLTIETIYLHNSTDLSLSPEGYTYCGVGTHYCDRAFYEIYGNGVYIADSKLNNTNTPLVGCQSQSGAYINGDYQNYPDYFTQPLSWLDAGGSTYARYNRYTLTREQAIAIADAGSGTTIDFSLLPGRITYDCPSSSVHSTVTSTRITNSLGEVLWNSCIVGENITKIDVCTTGNTGDTTTTTTTLPPTTTTTTTCIGVDCRYVFEDYGGGKVLNITDTELLIVLPQSDWVDGSNSFSDWESADLSVNNLTFSGYSDWRMPTVSEWEIIGKTVGAATQIGWNQYSYYWTSNSIDNDYAYKWRTSDDSGDMYNETYNIESVELKSQSGLYGIAIRTEIL